ncbi:hypothetical protein [Secundilactobacillus kimchicus]|uniref:hypothetical protein n=1 Tax=Secundilactobacillus kimchicus TaxID=528209 RepID=UPI0024A8844C|nr:hypothetical protein [Secundilactobacillus kimchicus]
MHYSNIDKKETKQNVIDLLESQRSLKIELAHLKLSTGISAIQYDGMPKGQGHVNGVEASLLHDIVKVQKRRDELTFRLACISNTLLTMHDVDEFNDYLATLLEYRYLKRWTVMKCCMQLVSDTDFGRGKYIGMVSESQFFEQRDQALLAFAEIYPERSKLIVEKTGDFPE